MRFIPTLLRPLLSVPSVVNNPLLLAIFGISIDTILNWVGAGLDKGGYGMLFGLLFLCGLGLPLPEDIPLLISGFLIYHHEFHLLPVAIAAWCGIIGGDCVLYYLGRRYGMNITRVPFIGKHVTASRIAHLEGLFGRYGSGVVVVCRLIAGLRGAMCVAAGAIRFSFIKFVITDGLAALVSGGFWVWLGHWGAGKLGDPATIHKRAAPYALWITIGLVVGAGLMALYIRWRRKKHETISDVIVEKVEKVVEKRKTRIGDETEKGEP